MKKSVWRAARRGILEAGKRRVLPMPDMFCFQCQQTAGGTGCVRTGVCGKQPHTAQLQDALICELIRLAQAAQAASRRTEESDRLLIDGLFTTLTNVNFDDARHPRLHAARRGGAPRPRRGGRAGLPALEGGDGHRFPAFDASVRAEGHGGLRAPRSAARQAGRERHGVVL